MLKVNLKKNKNGKGVRMVSAEGSTLDLVKDVSWVILCLYKRMQDKPKAAQGFREAIETIVVDPEFWECSL